MATICVNRLTVQLPRDRLDLPNPPFLQSRRVEAGLVALSWRQTVLSSFLDPWVILFAWKPYWTYVDPVVLRTVHQDDSLEFPAHASVLKRPQEVLHQCTSFNLLQL